MFETGQILMTDHDENASEDPLEDVIDEALDKTGFTTIAKLKPYGEGQDADDNIDAWLASMGLKKGKLVGVISSNDFHLDDGKHDKP